MFGRSTVGFDRLLEKATSQLLLEPDWTSTLMICDSIRQGDTNPKYAVAAIKKKFYHQNPHASLYALQVMESCVKNCGVLIHEEIATKVFMEELRDLVKQATDDTIKNKVLELLQTWGTAFRNSPKYRIVTDTLHLMQAEGWKFPPVREAEAMFEADTAPEWSEGQVCQRCRVQFSTFTRQHHCRACGQVFCGKCSGKTCVLPKFGIEREVRVCDSCFDQFGPKDEDSPIHQQKQAAAAGTGKESDLPEEYLASPLSKQPQEPVKPAGKTSAEIKEEEELQLVLALSKSEAEEKEKMKKKATSDILAGLENNKAKMTNGNGVVAKSPEEADPELAKYLNREYWESRSGSGVGDVGGRMEERAVNDIPEGVANAKQLAQSVVRVQNSLQGTLGGEERADDEELEDFTASLRTQLEIFVNRMKSNSSRGRPIGNDSSVQSLFVNMMTMHSKLVKYIQEQEDARVHYEGLQDKLSQVKDARAALDALREEERERRRREAEEAERQRQIVMAQKLDMMRKKKAEYLEYQRQMALQRMADQEREMAKMADVNKHNYLNQQQGMYNMYLPYGQQQQYQPFPGQPGIPGQPGMMPGQQRPMQPGPGMMMPGYPGQEGQAPGQQFYPAGQPDGSFNMHQIAGALPNMNQQQQQQQQQPAAPGQHPPPGQPMLSGQNPPAHVMVQGQNPHGPTPMMQANPAPMTGQNPGGQPAGPPLQPMMPVQNPTLMPGQAAPPMPQTYPAPGFAPAGPVYAPADGGAAVGAPPQAEQTLISFD